MSDKRIHKLVLDQSTSGTKLLLVGIEDNEAKILRRMDRKHKQIYPQEGWVEHDPIEIMQNARQLIATMLEETGLSEHDIQSLSLTNQRETVVAWNKSSGEPISNALVWQCNRSIDICERLIKDEKEAIIQQRTGLKIDSYFSGPKLKWLFENVDEMGKLANTGELAIGTIDAWLIWNLTDGEVFATEPSNACRTLLYNIYENSWDDVLCDVFLVPKNCLPEVRNSDDFFGTFYGIPIQGVMADSQAALYGQGCFNFGDVKMTLGTGSSVLMQIQNEVTLKSDNILRTIAFTNKQKTDFAFEGIIRSCGDTLTWLANELDFFETVEDGFKLAESVPDNGGVYLIPAQIGLAAPFWNSRPQAAFVGMNRSTTKAHLVRAGFESILYQLRAVIDELEVVSGMSLSDISVDGGVSRNERLMQMLANIIKKNIRVSFVEELSAVGVITLITDVNIPKNGKVYRYLSDERDGDYYTWLTYVNTILNAN